MTLRLLRIGLVILGVLFVGAILAPAQVGTPGCLIVLLIEALPDVILVLVVFALFDLVRWRRRRRKPALGSQLAEAGEEVIEPAHLSRLETKRRRSAR